MTSRLRHKLEIDPSVGGSSNLNESFVLIGTPLPALGDTKRDKGEFVPIWKQEVRDEKGRQRFHGAFTGGFTAGFGNTVGSKEGWTPSTFVSSRNARSSKQQKAEDFMDEEDLEQLKEGRQLENNEGFRNEGFAGTHEELKSRGPAEDPFTSTLSSLIQPARTSIGHTLLQKLGWRPGQGIGPRVSARKRKLQAQKLGLPLDDDEELDSEQMSKHTFAPRDVRLLVYEPKEGGEGLGFVKGLREALPGIDDGPSLGDDPYSANATASTSAEGNRFAFDLDDDDGDVIMMGAVSTKSKAKGKTKAAPLTSTGQVDQWHDGRPVPAGFVLDPKPVVSDKWFAMPDVPKGWTPRPSRVWEKGKRWDKQPGQAPVDDKAPTGRRTLTAEQRGAALGEEARKKSVFDYMSQKDKERLEAFAAAVKSGQAPVPVAPGAATLSPISAAPIPTSIDVPPLSPRTASAALKGFIPFGDDPDKQDRYRSYLTSQCHNTDAPNPSLLPNKPLNEQQRELNEFQKSGQMFKPMSFAMSNRFTSASAVLAASDSKISQSGLYVPDPNAAKAEAEESVTKMEVELTPRQQAAKNGMHGTMTRTVNDFYPVKLLCKRFGVADPHPGGVKAKAGAGGESGLGLPTELGAPIKTDISWTDKFIHVPGAEALTDPEPADAGAPKSSKPKSLGEVGLGEDENQGKDTLTYTKPSIDIFKAIFASDDEEDSDEEDDDVPFVPPTRLGVPKVAPTNEDDDKPVDLATFKPVFVARGSEKSKDKKKKKDKKRKGLLTFDMDEGEGAGDVDEQAERERKEKKRRKREEEEEEEEKKAKQDTAEDGEDEWVEKPAVVPQVGQGRKSAADYM